MMMKEIGRNSNIKQVSPVFKLANQVKTSLITVTTTEKGNCFSLIPWNFPGLLTRKNIQTDSEMKKTYILIILDF